jgi:Ca2+-transporting ATPase
VAPITTMFSRDMASPLIMNRKPRKVNEPIINTRMFARLIIAVFFMAAMALYLFQSQKTGNTRGIKPNLFFLLFNR